MWRGRRVQVLSLQGTPLRSQEKEQEPEEDGGLGLWRGRKRNGRGQVTGSKGGGGWSAAPKAPGMSEVHQSFLGISS